MFSMHMRPDDYKLPYYRDQTLALWGGISLLDILRQSVASRFDPAVGRTPDVQPLRLG